MQKQAPSLGRILVMVGFALSCFGLLLFLWLAFGGPIPLKPKGYRFKVSFKEAAQLAKRPTSASPASRSARSRSSTPDKQTGASDAAIQLDTAVRADPEGHEGDPAPEDAAGRDLRRADARAPRAPARCPRTAACPPAQCRRPSSSTRSSAPSTRRRATSFQHLDAAARRGLAGPRARHLRRAGQPRAVRRGHHDAAEAPQRPAAQRAGRRPRHRRVFAALSERDGQLRALIDNSNRVFATTAPRDRELEADLPRAADLRARVEDDLRPPDQVLPEHEPAGHPAAPRRARAVADAAASSRALAPDLKALFRDLNPLIDASGRACRRPSDFLDELHPLLANFDAPLRQLNPPLTASGQYKNELTAFFANAVGATQATTPEGSARVHYLRTTNPANPENLAVYPRRIGTNRPNPYEFPDAFKKLAAGPALLRDAPVRPGPCRRSSPTRCRACRRPALAHPGRPGDQRAEVLLRHATDGDVAGRPASSRASSPAAR